MGRNVEFRNAEQIDDIIACHAVMLQLRPHLNDVESFVQQVVRQGKRGFVLTAAWRDGQVVGVVGYNLRENLMLGRFVFVDDLVVREEFRSDGVGAQLLDVARAYARELTCSHFVLDTGLDMALAHRFYYRQGLLAHALGFSETL